MKNHLSRAALILGALAMNFMFPSTSWAQNQGGITGTFADTYVINKDNNNVFSSLRLQTSNDRGWNMVNRGDSLSWRFAPNQNHADTGIQKMQLKQSGNFGVVASGTLGGLGHGDKWIQLAAKPSFPNSPAAYGQRVQWDTNLGIFALKDNGTRKDLVIQYGGNNSGNDLRFEYFDGSNPHERMVITDAGNVGIGTDHPIASLHLADIYPAYQGRLLQIGDDVYFSDVDKPNFTLLTGSQNTDRVGLELGYQGGFLFGINGRIGINTTNPQSPLDVGGNAQFNGTVKPSFTNSHSLGTAHERWTELFATNGTVNTSDRRDKENVTTLSYGLDEILALRPVNYTWIERPDQGNQIGFIAQEANEIIPDVVFDPKEYTVQNEAGEWVPADLPEDTRFGIRYAMLTPILVKAIQEQQAQIEALQAALNRSHNDGDGPLKAGENSRPDAMGVPRLDQNAPNPFTGNTQIGYYLPPEIQRASLNIYDMQGRPIEVIELNERGEGSYLLDGSLLPDGMYLYALLAEGQEIDVKRMIINRQR